MKKPELWSNDWILKLDNAPAHKALSVKQFLVQKSIAEIEHPTLRMTCGCFQKNNLPF
jgi:hypothetical protein